MDHQTRKSHQAPTAHIPPFGLRLQSVLKAELERAATEAGRSLNAEICDRLRQSFEPMVDLEPDVLEALQQFAQARGLNVTDALSGLIRAGVSDGGSKIVSLHIVPGVTVSQLAGQLDEAAMVHPEAEVYLASTPTNVGASIGTMSGGSVRIKQSVSL